MTGLSIITRAMRLLQSIAPGENPSASEAADFLVSLNAMLDQWNAERLMIFTITRQVFSLTSGQQSYTVGTGGDFNIPRPSKIEQISIININNPAQPLELPIAYLTDAQWQAIPVKNVQGSLPLKVWDDGGFPLRTLYYWTIPNTAVQTAIYPWTALTSFADLTTDYTFPPGYEQAIVYNLAVNISPELGAAGNLSAIVVDQAIKAKAIIKGMNIEPIDMQCDAAVVNTKARVYDWRSDQMVGH